MATWNASGIARENHTQAGQKFLAPADAQMTSITRPIVAEMMVSWRRIIRQIASRRATCFATL